MRFPKGYGYRYEASDRWLLNHMIHNLTPRGRPRSTLQYTIDFIPDDVARPPRASTPVRPIWMDVENGSLYPGVQRAQGLGQDGQVHLPDRRSARPTRPRTSRRTPGRSTATACSWPPPATCIPAASDRPVAEAPGREGRAANCGTKATPATRKCRPARRAAAAARRTCSRSTAKYFEPAGAVSWDVAMTAHAPRTGWSRCKKGDVLEHHRHLRHQAGLLVGVDGNHGRLHGRQR